MKPGTMENKQEISTTTSSATMFKDFSAKLRLSSFSYDNIATVGQYLGTGLQKWRDGSFLLDINLVGRLFGGGGGIGQKITPRRRLHSEEPLKSLWLNDKVIPTTHDECFNHIEDDIHTINNTDVLYYKNHHQNGHDYKDDVCEKGSKETVADSVNTSSSQDNTRKTDLPCFEQCTEDDYFSFNNDNLKLDTGLRETSTDTTGSIDSDMFTAGIVPTVHDEESNKENESVLNKQVLLNQDEKQYFESDTRYLLQDQLQENDNETLIVREDIPQQQCRPLDGHPNKAVSKYAEANSVDIPPVTEEIIFKSFENELFATTKDNIKPELTNRLDTYEDEVFLSASDITKLFEGANSNLENDSSTNDLNDFDNKHVNIGHGAAVPTESSEEQSDQEVASSFVYLNVLDGHVTCRILTPCLEEEIRTKILSDDTDLEFLNISDGRVSFKSRSSLDRDFIDVFDEEESFNIDELFGESNETLCETESCTSDSLLVDISNLFEEKQVAKYEECSVHAEPRLSKSVNDFYNNI